LHFWFFLSLENISLNTQRGWGHDSSCRAPAWLVQGPDYKHQKKFHFHFQLCMYLFN
jgi:hypothetical protein